MKEAFGKWGLDIPYLADKEQVAMGSLGAATHFMTIEIHNPELEVILQQRLKAGNFANVEDMLLETLRSSPEASPATAPKTSLLQFFRESPLVGLELEFERDRDTGRDITL